MATGLAQARSLVGLRRYDEALTALSQASVDGDETAEAHCLRAQALLGLGKAREAGEAARAACALSPHEEWPHRLLAISEQDRGRHRRALAAAKEAARVAPWSLHAQHVLALTQVNVGDTVGAELTAARCAEQSPQTPLAHQTVARVALATGKLDAAEAAARRVLSLRPQDDDGQALLADILERRGRSREASELRVAAVRSNPHSRSHRRRLASRAAGPVIALGWLGKFFVVQGVVQGGRLARDGGASDAAGAGSDSGGLPHGVVLLILHAVVLGIWGVWAWRRRQAGRDLPAGFYEGLRPERRMSDTTWLLVVGALMCILATADLVDWAWGDVGGDVLAGDTVVGVGEVVLALGWRRRLAQRYDVRPRRWRVPDFVALPAARLAGGRRLATSGRGPLDGLRPAGEPRGAERLASVVRPSLLVWFLPALAMTVDLWFGVAAWVVTGAVLEVRGSRRPGGLSGGGYRVVVSADTAAPPDRGRLATRGALRALLIPLGVLELLAFVNRPHRCLHDRVSGTTVSRFRTALDTEGWSA